MKRWLLILALILPFAFPLAAQNVRFDLPIYTTQAQGGNLLPVYAIPGAGIKFYSCSGSTCTTLATTYISATSSTTCPVSPTPMQVTLNGSSTCVSSADPYGNMGGWFQPGQYMATITAQGASYNYYFTVGVGPGGVGCFPNTVPNGCTGGHDQLSVAGALGIPGPVQNVVNYGAVGDGVLLTATGTDNYSAIQNAINTGLIAKQPVFFPCGIYEISHPLTMYGLTSVPLVGPAGPCALIQYNGGSTAQGVLTIAGSQPATPCTSASCDPTTGQPACCANYYQQDNLGIVGNSSTPDVLDLLGVDIFDIENAILVGSSTTELFCMSCGPSGHFLNLNLAYNALLGAYGYTPYHTPTHLKVDGYSSNSGAGQLVFDGLISEFAGTNGIWITRGANITFSNCQLSGNPVNVQLDASDTIIFDHGCLLEAGAAAGAVNITTGAVATEFRDVSISGLLTVDGSGTTIDGGGYGPITLNSDATSTSIKNVDYSDALSTFVSNEPDAEWDKIWSANTGEVSLNFPAKRFTPQSALGIIPGTVSLSGLWETSGSSQQLDPTPLPVFATPWRVAFDGRWIAGNGIPAAPTHQEVTDSSPSFTLAGGEGAITVSMPGGVASVASSGGSDMTPGTYALAFSGGGGSGAAGTITVTADTVTNITITSNGSGNGTGYSSAPSVSAATGGTPPTLTATMGNYLTFSGSGLGGDTFFGGNIAFYPAVTSDSASFAGNVNALAYEVNGSLLSTTNLADWTNSGVANGDVPVWDAGTGQWTPGAGGGSGCANALTMNNSGSGASSGTTFDCGAAETLSYNTLGAAPAVTCTTVSSLSPANGGCYNLSTSSSVAMPAASAFTIFTVNTGSGQTATFTGTTLTSDAGCSSYLSGTTLALTGNQSIVVKSDGTNIWASCTVTGGTGTVTDGAGSSTANQLVVATATPHVQGYVTTLPTAAVPAFTGDATNTGGSLGLTVSKINGVALSGLATGPLCNTTSTGVPSACAVTGTGNVVQATSPSIASPTFTGTITGAGTHPLSVLATQATNTIDMNATAGTASPTAVAMPTCTAGADLYNTTTSSWSCVSTGGGTPAYPLTISGGVSGGVVYGSSGTQLTVSPAGTVNVLMKWGGAATAPGNSSITDNGTTIASAEPVALGPANCTTFGTAGGLCMTEGGDITNVSGTAALDANSTSHELAVATNGSTSYGMLVRAQPGAIRSTGLLAAVTTATLCAASAGACNVAGTYHVHVALYQSGSPCTANTTGGVSPSITWTDANGTTHSAIGIPLQSDGVVNALTGTMLWGATTVTGIASGDYNIDTNGTVIQYAIAFAQCNTGTATYAASLVVTRLK